MSRLKSILSRAGLGVAVGRLLNAGSGCRRVEMGKTKLPLRILGIVVEMENRYSSNRADDVVDVAVAVSGPMDRVCSIDDQRIGGVRPGRVGIKESHVKA